MRAPEDLKRAGVRNVLVIRQHDMLGDFLLATPVLRALRLKFPRAHIGVLVRDYFADTVRNNSCIDEILVLQKSGTQWDLPKILALLKSLFRRWDLTVVLSTVSHSLSSDILAALSGGKFILGSENMIFPGSSRNFFYNLLAPYAPGTRHQTERNLDIVRYIGADTADLSEMMQLEDSERATARKRLQRLGLDGTGPVVAMHIGAGKPANRWPVARFAGLAQSLYDALHARILLCWGVNEQDLALEFCRAVTFSPIRIEPGELRGLASIFAQCDLLVCNDTGVMHVGAAVGVPLVAIFGPTDPVEWKPQGDTFTGIRGRITQCTASRWSRWKVSPGRC